MNRPGTYYHFGMHAGEDATRVFVVTGLYSAYDKSAGTGTAVDLTGCSFAAEGKNAAGVTQWAVVPTAAAPTSGEVTVVIPLATTTSKKGLEGEWALRVTWADGSKTYPVWGRWSISSVVLVS